jgi:hypothetical protein
MRNLILIITLFTGTVSNAQSVHFDWAATFNGDNFKVTTDPAGNVLVSGNFTGTMDADPGASVYSLTSNGAEDAFFIKLDTDGNLIWANNLGGPGSDGVSDISFDDQGDIYVAGYYRDSVDFDAGIGEELFTADTDSDIFLLKMDGSGQFIWAQSLGGTGSIGLFDFAVGNSGTVYITGFFQGSPDMDPGSGQFLLTSFNPVFYTAKYDTDGSFLWAFQAGNYGSYLVSDITVDESENLYWSYQVNNHVELQKRTPDGTLSWTKVLNSNSAIIVNSIATDDFGHILLAGIFRNFTDFDPGPGVVDYYGSLTNNTGFVEQLDTNGIFLWVKPLFTNISTDYYDITADLSGNVLLTGEYRSNCDFDLGPAINLHTPSDISSNAFVQKLDSSGNFKWVKTIDGTQHQSGRRIVADAFGNVYITGLFQLTADFDPGPDTFNLTASGNSWFVEKFSDCAPVTSLATITACPPYTWADGITYTTNNNTATFNYCSTTTDGCDSIVSLDLTLVNSLNPIVTSDTLSLTVNLSGVDYQWRDCGTGLPVLGQTSQTFTPWQNGSYAVITSSNGCVDTSSCVIIDQLAVSDLSKTVTEIYPNPSNGSFTVRGIPGSDISEMKLITMDGKQVNLELVTEAVSDSEFTIKCQAKAYSKGIYSLLVFTKNQGIITYRIELQ